MIKIMLRLHVIYFKNFGEDFQRFVFACGYYFDDNVGGATIWTNINYTCPTTICVQYPRILFSSLGEEDFQKFALK